MRYAKWTFLAVVAAAALAFLHYTLPQTDIVRITDTYEKRIDFGANSLFWSRAESGSDPEVTNRDVFFIQAIRANGRPMVYRNEDTGWGWPPYLKFDTSNLQTEAADLRSAKDEPTWVALRHYGWRFEILSIFPNALSMRSVEGPDVSLFPWFNVVFLVVLALLLFWLRRTWMRFRRRFVDPLICGASEKVERVGDRIDGRVGVFRRWIDSLRHPSRR